MSVILSRFKSLLKREGANVVVLWDKLNDISRVRDEEELGFSLDDLKIDSPIDEDFLVPAEETEPTIEEVLNKLVVLDLTTNPDNSSELSDQLRIKGIGFLAEFLESLTEAEVMDYITEDMSFDNSPIISTTISDKICDQEIEVIEILEKVGNSRVFVSLNDYKEVCNLCLYVSEGSVYMILDGTTVEFRHQDEELLNAVVRELRSNNYSIGDNISDWVD